MPSLPPPQLKKVTLLSLLTRVTSACSTNSAYAPKPPFPRSVNPLLGSMSPPTDVGSSLHAAHISCSLMHSKKRAKTRANSGLSGVLQKTRNPNRGAYALLPRTSRSSSTRPRFPCHSRQHASTRVSTTKRRPSSRPPGRLSSRGT